MPTGYSILEGALTMESALFDDITVLELAQGVTGPYATMQLGDFGARVIKVEPLPGDWARAMGPPFVGQESALFLSLNRNKQSLGLDYTTADGLELLRQLVTRTDVLVIDLLPAERIARQLTYTELSRLNPRLIYCAITPFGEQGPMCNQPGAELVLQAMSGYTRYVGTPGGEPVRLGADIAGINSALFAYQAIVAALIARQQSGIGQEVRLSQLGSLLATKTIMISAQYNPDEWDGFHLASTTDAPEHGWQTRDHALTFDFGTSPDGWQQFCRELGLEYLIDDPRFADWYRTMCMGAEAQVLRHEYERGFGDKSAEELIALIRELGGNAFPYLQYDELLDSEQVHSLDFLEDVPHPAGGTLRMIGFPWQFSDLQPRVRTAPPHLGEHTGVILQELLRIDASRVQTLHERRIVAMP
jgi:crotonobetainyl-CoA:carnitine CoA-transferase CaiB-like acyl-CoA transferase